MSLRSKLIASTLLAASIVGGQAPQPTQKPVERPAASIIVVDAASYSANAHYAIEEARKAGRVAKLTYTTTDDPSQTVDKGIIPIKIGKTQLGIVLNESGYDLALPATRNNEWALATGMDNIIKPIEIELAPGHRVALNYELKQDSDPKAPCDIIFTVAATRDVDCGAPCADEKKAYVPAAPKAAAPAVPTRPAPPAPPTQLEARVTAPKPIVQRPAAPKPATQTTIKKLYGPISLTDVELLSSDGQTIRTTLGRPYTGNDTRIVKEHGKVVGFAPCPGDALRITPKDASLYKFFAPTNRNTARTVESLAASGTEQAGVLTYDEIRREYDASGAKPATVVLNTIRNTPEAPASIAERFSVMPGSCGVATPQKTPAATPERERYGTFKIREFIVTKNAPQDKILKPGDLEYIVDNHTVPLDKQVPHTIGEYPLKIAPAVKTAEDINRVKSLMQLADGGYATRFSGSCKADVISIKEQQNVCDITHTYVPTEKDIASRPYAEVTLMRQSGNLNLTSEQSIPFSFDTKGWAGRVKLWNKDSTAEVGFATNSGHDAGKYQGNYSLFFADHIMTKSIHGDFMRKNIIPKMGWFTLGGRTEFDNARVANMINGEVSNYTTTKLAFKSGATLNDFNESHIGVYVVGGVQVENWKAQGVSVPYTAESNKLWFSGVEASGRYISPRFVADAGMAYLPIIRTLSSTADTKLSGASAMSAYVYGGFNVLKSKDTFFGPYGGFRYGSHGQSMFGPSGFMDSTTGNKLDTRFGFTFLKRF